MVETTSDMEKPITYSNGNGGEDRAPTRQTTPCGSGYGRQ